MAGNISASCYYVDFLLFLVYLHLFSIYWMSSMCDFTGIVVGLLCPRFYNTIALAEIDLQCGVGT